MNIYTYMVKEGRNYLLAIRDNLGSCGVFFFFWNADVSFKLSPELPAN